MRPFALSSMAATSSSSSPPMACSSTSLHCSATSNSRRRSAQYLRITASSSLADASALLQAAYHTVCQCSPSVCLIYSLRISMVIVYRKQRKEVFIFVGVCLQVDTYVKSGMVIGLGSGQASAMAIEYLGRQLRVGAFRDVVGIPT